MNNSYKVGMYLRLSKEDDKNTESNSIGSQREIITNYIKQNNLELVSEYIDDGITGTSFDRYGFNKMIKDIKLKKINMVIVKDLSRLGRDHIEFGTYVERFFPENNIRLVALGDMYDSASIENNNTTVLYDYKKNSLVRKNEELRMDYLFDVNRKTEGTIEIKEIGKSIVLPIKTTKLERKNNNIEVEFEIDQKNFLYKIEEKI